MMQTVPRIDDGIALPDGRWLAYAEFGDPEGRPVLFFHATPGYRRNPWATDAELRSAGVRLIAPDRPGVGRSTPQPHRRLLDWPDDVRQLADALALQRFAVVGFSNGGPHAAACACKLGPRVSGTALVAPLPPLDAPGAVRLLVSGMSQADRRLFGRPEWAGRFGADLAGAGSRGIADDERLMPLPWRFAPEQVEGPVRLWLGEHDELVPARVWLERPSPFPVCDTTVVAGAGHFLIAEQMAEIVGTV